MPDFIKTAEVIGRGCEKLYNAEVYAFNVGKAAVKFTQERLFTPGGWAGVAPPAEQPASIQVHEAQQPVDFGE